MTPDYRAMCANLTAALNDWQCETGDDRYEGLLARARALLAEPEPEGASDEELLATLNQAVADFPPRHPEAEAMNAVGYPLALELRKARAVLARWGRPAAAPVPEPGEARELVEWLTMLRDHDLRHDAAYAHPAIADHWNDFLTRAADLLEQLSAPAPVVVPVPVSERLPGPEDCDTEDNCWWFDPHADGAWYVDTFQSCYTHWLPAHALPLPTPEATND